MTGKLTQRKSLFAMVMLFALALTYGVMLTRPFEYQATVQLLIIQNQSENQDLLSTLRATEQVGKNLVDVIYTSTFFDKVFATEFPIAKQFSDQPEQRRQEWRQAVRASVSQQSGILTVLVYDQDKEQAAVLARSVAHVLTDDSQDFHGKSNIIVKVVDDVYVKKWPVRPNLIGGTLAALFFGALAGLAVITLLPAGRRQPKSTPPTSPKPSVPVGRHPGDYVEPGNKWPNREHEPVHRGNPPARLPVATDEGDES